MSIASVNLLSVNEMTSLLHLAEDFSNGFVPVTEAFISELFSLREGDYAFKTVNSSLDSFVDYHVAEFSFNSVLRDAQKTSNSTKADAAVVFLDDSEVVLAELLQEGSHVSFRTVNSRFEGIVGLHFFFNFVLLDRHQFESK